jgi:hypothetical protein
MCAAHVVRVSWGIVAARKGDVVTPRVGRIAAPCGWGGGMGRVEGFAGPRCVSWRGSPGIVHLLCPAVLPQCRTSNLHSPRPG